MMNEIDAKILNILQENSRLSNAEIARQINMAPSAVFERIRKLEERKIIKAFTTQINPVEVGRGLLAFIQVKANGPVVDLKVAKEIAKIQEVQEVHIVAGEDSYLVKVRVENPEALTQLLRTKFASIKSIRTTNTTIVLETIKETNELVF
ncbi:MAG: AsnC family transcriptional regulator [Ignavibacteria bacterium CG2_30_36_16]|nr:Lrp/AsnC family transcriptional regulator [Ignavibacteria bacterium]OIP54472.1 MAG: AsnC family transcriptional regulator [Ignavibacteria bacterium CG2_30_36_16]